MIFPRTKSLTVHWVGTFSYALFSSMSVISVVHTSMTRLTTVMIVTCPSLTFSMSLESILLMISRTRYWVISLLKIFSKMRRNTRKRSVGFSGTFMLAP